ncbi:unnamed protein product [Arctogadus glacialis]
MDIPAACPLRTKRRSWRAELPSLALLTVALALFQAPVARAACGPGPLGLSSRGGALWTGRALQAVGDGGRVPVEGRPAEGDPDEPLRPSSSLEAVKGSV